MGRRFACVIRLVKGRTYAAPSTRFTTTGAASTIIVIRSVMLVENERMGIITTNGFLADGFRGKVMKSFDKIEAMAGKHHGGPKGLAAKLAEWPVDTNFKTMKDSRFLAGMAKAVFSSGFSWQVIDKKWPG